MQLGRVSPFYGTHRPTALSHILELSTLARPDVTASIYVYKQGWLLLGIMCRLTEPSLTAFTIMNWSYYCLTWFYSNSHPVLSKGCLTI